ncbi:MAG: hypothetical protein ACOX4H_12485 [Bacillota bacterium]|jgi:hypothetical protein|nr:hypothetical protein [Clostridia bacterium]
MNLIILDQSYKFANEPESVPALLNTVEDILTKNNMILSHLVIDGLEVNEDYENYLLNNIDLLTNISVEARTLEEWLDEMIVSASEYLNRCIPALEELGTEFYQGPDQDSWLNFEQMLEGIEWLNQLVDQISRQESLAKKIDIDNVEQELALQDVLLELEDAIRNKDTVLIADTIIYEILPRYNSLKQKLSAILSSEVLEHGSN